MTSSSWPARRMTLKNQTPSIVPTKPPPRRKAESLRSIASRRQAASALVIDEAAICACWVPTAIAGGMPRKIRSGVIRKPPPIPNSPEMKPTAAPIARMSSTLTGISAIGR